MKGAVGTLNILLIAENENDHLLVQSLLREIRNHDDSLAWVRGSEPIETELRRGVHEVVLLDSRFDNGAGLEILRDIRRDAGLPVIILADAEDHEFDVAATAAGAYDYLVKKHINAPLLERSLRYALGRRKMEAELRAALSENQRFGGAIDNLITGVVITDVTQPGNPIIFVNSTFTQITGYTFEEAVGRNGRFLIGPDTKVETRRAISDAFEKKIPFHGQILNYRKDGTPFWNELKLSPLFEKGKVQHYVGLIEDVSMRVEAELWRHQLLSDLAERVKELTLLQTVSRKLQDDSISLEESLVNIVRKIPSGFRIPEQIVAKLSFDGREYFSMESPGAEYFGAPDSAANKADESKHTSLEFQLRLSDEREGCLWVSHRADAPPDAAPFLAEERIMLKSIVEMLRSRLEQELAHKALEKANQELEMRVQRRTRQLELRSQELRDSEERLRRINREVLKLSKLRIPRFVNLETLFRSFTEAAVRSMDIDRASIWLYSEDRAHLRCINAFDRDSGKHSGGQVSDYSADYPEEYRSIDQERVFASDDVTQDKRIVKFYEKYLKSSDVRSLLIAPVLKAGQVVGVFVLSRLHEPRAWPLEDKTYAGSLADLVALELEAVEHRKMEESLRVASREAEEARRSAEAANRAKSEFLSRMSHELRTPLNSILGFGQLLQRDQITEKQRGRVDLIVTAGKHLLALINEVLDLARVESGNISLSLEPVRLNEVIEETLSLVSPLAARYLVTLHNSPASEDRFILADRQKVQQVLLNLLSNAVKYNHENGTVRVWCEEVSAERLQISVANTGRGIAQADLQRIFQPFERLMAEGSEIEGTGLGLALARNLVEAMGGVIEVESTPDVETVFSVTLPAASQPDRIGLSEKAAHRRLALGEICVLYIEDNLTNLKLIESILAEQSNIRLLTAMQGGLGLELAREHHPDVVLLDLHLPDLEGDEVLRRLKANRKTESIPVVVLSADATSRQIRHMRDLGAFDYLTKPVDIEQFLESIGRAVAR